jgi:hypothetical protein
VPFDSVFCPEDPASSAHWNPLAGPDPVQAARAFAAALFPAAALPGASFYEQKAVWVITRVAPAMALTGHGIEAQASPAEPAAVDPSDPDADEHARVAALVAAGVSERRALPLARRHSQLTPQEILRLPLPSDPSTLGGPRTPRGLARKALSASWSASTNAPIGRSSYASAGRRGRPTAARWSRAAAPRIAVTATRWSRGSRQLAR